MEKLNCNDKNTKFYVLNSLSQCTVDAPHLSVQLKLTFLQTAILLMFNDNDVLTLERICQTLDISSSALKIPLTVIFFL